MGEQVKLAIQGQECTLLLRVYQGQRVVTFRDIDTLHRRPEGTAARNFNTHHNRFIQGTDFFWLPYEELKSTDFVEFPSRNGLTVITESGYLMLAKSLTDDVAWDVQRQLIAGYFRARDARMSAPSTLDLFELALKGLREQQERLDRLEAENRRAEVERNEQASQLTTLGHRVASLDLTNIDGTPRQRLVKMVQLYAYRGGLTYQTAWRRFDAAFNTAFRTNLTLRRQKYAEANGLTRIDRPEYLEIKGQIEDAIRVADKMLNGASALVG